MDVCTGEGALVFGRRLHEGGHRFVSGKVCQFDACWEVKLDPDRDTYCPFSPPGSVSII